MNLAHIFDTAGHFLQFYDDRSLLHLLWQTVSVQSCQKSSAFFIYNRGVQKSETTFEVSCKRGYN